MITDITIKVRADLQEEAFGSMECLSLKKVDSQRANV